MLRVVFIGEELLKIDIVAAAPTVAQTDLVLFLGIQKAGPENQPIDIGTKQLAARLDVGAHVTSSSVNVLDHLRTGRKGQDDVHGRFDSFHIVCAKLCLPVASESMVWHLEGA